MRCSAPGKTRGCTDRSMWWWRKSSAHRERVPGTWTIDGTTGYEFLNVLNGLFIDRRDSDKLTDIYTRFAGKRRSFANLVYHKKKLVMADVMASEITMLARRLHHVAQLDRDVIFTLSSLRRAGGVRGRGIYRTYIENSGGTDKRDRRYVQEAVTGRAAFARHGSEHLPLPARHAALRPAQGRSS